MKIDQLTDGNRLFEIRARKVLPYLVRQAKAREPITYGELANEVGMPNARNLNHILGLIGDAIITLNKKEKNKIPPIQCLVVNKNTHLPGDGISYYVSEILARTYSKLDSKGKRQVVDNLLQEIYSYGKWDFLLKKLQLHPLKFDLAKELNEARNFRGSGETEAHKKFKKFIAENPSAIGLKDVPIKVTEEYRLPSADKIDVLFDFKKMKIGVEVKSIESNDADILRGIFQCIKYKYLIEADEALQRRSPNCRVILAIQGRLSKKLMDAKNCLCVEVVEAIEK